MLALLQIITHMMVTLEYNELEVDEAFTAIVNGDETIDTLCNALNLDMSKTMRQLAQGKVKRWESVVILVNLQKNMQ